MGGRDGLLARFAHGADLDRVRYRVLVTSPRCPPVESSIKATGDVDFCEWVRRVRKWRFRCFLTMVPSEGTEEGAITRLCLTLTLVMTMGLHWCRRGSFRGAYNLSASQERV